MIDIVSDMIWYNRHMTNEHTRTYTQEYACPQAYTTYAIILIQHWTVVELNILIIKTFFAVSASLPDF